jgi:5-methyltetrahydropteroyltriglutamate--homocysteine methyltransferase
MFKASAEKVLATSIIGSLPRPSWYTESLGTRSFLDAMVNVRYREQYEDALSVYLGQQAVAGLDILTDGDCRFDHEVGGQSWARYPAQHMSGFDAEHPKLAPAAAHGVTYQRGHILHDYLEARVVPAITGPVGRGNLQYAEMWKTAQRLTSRPVKFGTITPELLAFTVEDHHYGDVRERIMAISDALNEELHILADAGCPVIQIEEPQIHLAPVRGMLDEVITLEFLRDVFNNTVKGLRAKTEVWCHTCWGNPSQQRLFSKPQSYAPALETLNQVDADVVTFETRSSGTGDIAAIGEQIADTDKKIAIGVIDHHTLQVESAEEVAELGRVALQHIPPERLIFVTDCGMGREGMSRRHAYYKIVALVLGTNILRRELGLPEAECRAADPSLSLIPAP